MPHLRQNLVTKQWVVISTERARRPRSLVAAEPAQSPNLPSRDPGCPFCPDSTGEEEFLRIPAEGPWSVRVLGNKYPALDHTLLLQRKFDGVERLLTGVGYHEVVVEGQDHNLSPATAPADLLLDTLLAFQARGQALAKDPRIEHIEYFKNHGAAAGASLPHPHSQIVGLPVVPQRIRSRMVETRRYYDDNGECSYCTMLREEELRGERIIVANEHAVAFVLYAALSPFHVWVVPRRHLSNFLEASSSDLRGVVECLHRVLGALHHGLNDPPYNYVLRSCPVRDSGREYVHWHVSVVARMSTAAGFELGSGMYINPTLPEESAAFLRQVLAGGA